MQPKQKQQIVEQLLDLVKFIEAESIGLATLGKITELLGRPSESGLVRWYNEECQPLAQACTYDEDGKPHRQGPPLFTQTGDVIKEVIGLIAKVWKSHRFPCGFSSIPPTDVALRNAKEKLPAKIALLQTLCRDESLPKLTKPEVVETMRQFLEQKLDSGESFAGVKQTVRDFKARYGCGSAGTVSNVLATNERLRDWSNAKSVSAKSYAQVYAETSPIEFIDETELESIFIRGIKDYPPTDQAEAKRKFAEADLNERKKWVDAMRS